MKIGEAFLIDADRPVQVLLIVKKTPTLRKISFVAHSLGGLFARFAIAVLYEPPIHSGGNSAAAVDETQASLLGTIAGLQPITLVTLATPHLGVRGKKQVLPDFASSRRSNIPLS